MKKAPYETPVWEISAPIQSGVIRTSLGIGIVDDNTTEYSPLL